MLEDTNGVDKPTVATPESEAPKNPAAPLPDSLPAARVVWTPEDATHFLKAAIQEAHRPLLANLSRQGVPHSVVIVGLLVLALTLGGGGFLGYRLYHEHLQASRQAEKIAATHRALLETEKSALRANSDLIRQKLITSNKQVAQLEARASFMALTQRQLMSERDTARSALASLRGEQKEVAKTLAKTLRTLREENIRLKTQAPRQTATLADREKILAALKKQNAALQQDNLRQRNNAAQSSAKIKILRLQLEGAEEEKAALRKQLQATMALLEALRTARKRLPPPHLNDSRPFFTPPPTPLPVKPKKKSEDTKGKSQKFL